MKFFLYEDEKNKDNLNWFKMNDTKLIHTVQKSIFTDRTSTEIRLTRKGNYVINDKIKNICGSDQEIWRLMTKQEVDRILKKAKADIEFQNSLEV